jgi:hypothetical protein
MNIHSPLALILLMLLFSIGFLAAYIYIAEVQTGHMLEACAACQLFQANKIMMTD